MTTAISLPITSIVWHPTADDPPDDDLVVLTADGDGEVWPGFKLGAEVVVPFSCEPNMKRTVISHRALPVRLPIWTTISTLLALDVWHASDVVRGAAWVLLALAWALAIWVWSTETQKTPAGFGEDKETKR